MTEENSQSTNPASAAAAQNTETQPAYTGLQIPVLDRTPEAGQNDLYLSDADYALYSGMTENLPPPTPRQQPVFGFQEQQTSAAQTPAPVEEPVPAETEPEVAADEPEPEPEPTPVSPDDDDSPLQPDGKFKSRKYRPQSVKDQAILDYAKAHGVPLHEAALELFGAPSQTQEPARAAPEPVDEVAALETEMESVSAELERATGEFDAKAITAATRKLAKLSARAESLKSNAEFEARQVERDQKWEARQAEQTLAQAREASKAQAIALYPEVNIKDSPLFKETQQVIEDLKEAGDPRVTNADFPLHAARIAALRLGIKPGARSVPKVTQPASRPAPQPVQPSPIAGGNARATHQTVASNAQGVTAADISNMSSADYEAFINANVLNY